MYKLCFLFLQATLNINLLGSISVTKTFLPLVRLAGGRVVNTASVVGRFAFPPAPYTISKYCLEAYTDVLRREMTSLGVSVHTIEPGGYQTNITGTWPPFLLNPSCQHRHTLHTSML